MSKVFSSKVAFDFPWSGSRWKVPVCKHAAPEEVFPGRADAEELCEQAKLAGHAAGIGYDVTFAEQGEESPLPAPANATPVKGQDVLSSKFGLRFKWSGEVHEVGPCEGLLPTQAFPDHPPMVARDLCIQAVAFASQQKGIEPGDVTFGPRDATADAPPDVPEAAGKAKRAKSDVTPKAPPVDPDEADKAARRKAETKKKAAAARARKAKKKVTRKRKR